MLDTVHSLGELGWQRFLHVSLLAISIGVLYLTAKRLYLLFLHPLASFRGPRNAALSQRWIFGLSQDGFVEADLARFHDEYGTSIIRIGPNELHINDVNYFKIIYGQGSKFLKDENFYRAFGAPKSIFATADIDLHRAVRANLNPYFSKRAISTVQGIITDSLRDYDTRLHGRGFERPVNLYNFCRCLPPDVITKYACGRSCSAIMTSNDNFDAPVLESFDASASATWSRAYFPTARRIQDVLGLKISALLSSDAAKIKGFVDFTKASHQAYRGRTMEVSHPVIFDALNESSEDVVTSNATAIIAGGSDTTGYTLAFACWHLLKNPDMVTKLRAAVDPVFDLARPGIPDLTVLEQIPYLSGVVQESLRLGMAASSRLPRIVPADSKSPLVIEGKRIPPGTVVGMSVYTMHRSPEIWGPDANDFKPERWLLGGGKELSSHLLSFSSGKRNCIGQNLAKAELIMAIAYLFHKYDIKPHGNAEDIRILDAFTASMANSFEAFMIPREF